MKEERIRKWAKFLRDLPKKYHKNFDMRTWGSQQFKPLSAKSCGSSACMLGWAAVNPAFRRLGLIQGPSGPILINPKTKKKIKTNAEEAGMQFFGLTGDQFMNLVYNPFITTPHDAADALLKLVNSR